MKKEEQILRALGSVKEPYILEASKFVGNSQSEVVLHSKKRGWGRFAAIAAMLTLVVSSLLVFRHWNLAQVPLPTEAAADIPPQGYDISPYICRFPLGSSDSTLTVEIKVSYSDFNYRPINQIEVYKDDELIQIIIPPDDAVPSDGYAYDGLYINVGSEIGMPDYRDVNFDGYTDFGCLAVRSYPKNVPYCYFLWNPDKEQFEYGFTMFGASALTVDEEHQLLVEEENSTEGPSYRYFSMETGRPVEVAAPINSGADPLPTSSVSEEAALYHGEEGFLSQPVFTIEYDETLFQLANENGATYIRPALAQEPQKCELEIRFMNGLLPCTAAALSRADWQSKGYLITDSQESEELSFTATNAFLSSIDPDSAQSVQVHFVSVGSLGTFQITSRCSMETAEEYGVVYEDMIKTFTVPMSHSACPEAEKAIIDFADAFFANDHVRLQSHLDSAAAMYGTYNGNGNAVQMIALSGLEAGFSGGAVSLTFAISQEDSYTYLSMEVVKSGDEYKIASYGLEK